MPRALVIAARLLEDESDPIRDWLMSEPGVWEEVLPRFKEQVAGYIKWVAADAYDPQDLEIVETSSDFDQVLGILKKYEDAPSFLEMVQAGYF